MTKNPFLRSEAEGGTGVSGLLQPRSFQFLVEKTTRIDCTVVSWAANGTQFGNIADAGGVYNGAWVQAVSRWVTKVYAPSKTLPRTGY